MWSPKFSVGYNFDLEGFLELIKKYHPFIESVYFPIPKKYMGSGRVLDEPINYETDILDLMKKLNEYGIAPFMLLNPTIVTDKQMQSAIKYTKNLHKNGFLSHVTVTDPYLMMLLRDEVPELFIEASTLCRVKTPQEAKYFKELGVFRITSDRETIRDIKALTSISKVLPLKVLANEGCIKNCIYKYAHYNMLSLQKEETPFFPIGNRYKDAKKRVEERDQLCVFSVKKHPYKVFSSPFIRPEDLKRYRGVTDSFKISTRNFDTGRIEKVLKAYIHQSFGGNLVELLNTAYVHEIFDYIDNSALNKARFFDKLSSCDDDCEKCSFCKELLVKSKAKIKNRF